MHCEFETVTCDPLTHMYNEPSLKFILWNQMEERIKIHRGSYMSAHVLLNLLNELGKRDKMRGLLSILSLFRNEFNKFNNRFYLSYDIKVTLKPHFSR